MADELTPPRVRRSIRRMAMWVVPVLLLIAAWQVWDAIETQRLDRALALVAGSPVPMEIPPAGSGRGAGKYYAAASILAVSLAPRQRIQAGPNSPLVDVATGIRDALARGEAPSKEALSYASREIEAGRGIFDLLSRASELPFDGFTPGTDFNYRVSGLIDVNRLAGLETINRAINGQGDGAARMLLDRIRSLRAFDEERLILHMLRTRQVQEIASDIGILAARAVGDDRLSELDRALAETYTTDALERAIRGAALSMHGEFRAMWEGRGYRGFIIIGPLLRPLLRHHAVMRLQTASQAIAAARRPWPDRIDTMNRITERRTMVPEVFHFVAASRMVSVFRDETVRNAEAVAAVRCARLVIAIERYRRARGLLPSSLSDIASPGEDQTLDPFTGKSLLFSRRDAGYVVYSIGRNGKDDGGKLVPDLPRGRVPGTLPAPDVGVRVMLNPAR